MVAAGELREMAAAVTGMEAAFPEGKFGFGGDGAVVIGDLGFDGDAL